ncbi:MAG: methyl-accepting chemotaxis protein [Proteocatella sp.]
MRKKGIMTKLVAMMAAIMFFISGIIGGASIYFLYSSNMSRLDQLETQMRSNYDINIKSQVDIIISELDGVANQVSKGLITPEQGKTIAADVVRNAKYGEGGYFWADTLEGINVVFLGKTESEGTSRLNMVDDNGNKIIQNFIEIVKKDGEGYSEYYFPKPGDDTPLPKRAFVKLYQPYGWVIGTGNYIDDIDNFIKAERDVVIKDMNKVITTLAIFVVLSFISGFLISYKIAGNIVRPIKRLQVITEELANGNLDVNIDVNTNDEINLLATSMRTLTERLVKYIDYIDEISLNLDKIGDGNLNIELTHEYDGEFSIIKDSLIKTTDNFKKTIGDISQIASQVASGSDQVASGAQALAQGTTEQASSLEQLSATINTISEQVNQNAKNALDSSQYIKTVGASANMSSSKMNEMMTAIEEINTKSSEIGKIVKTIDDIAFQTNILALNAAVEAARAGSAGKGFAVVADEVRSLANKSSEAAKNTTALIEDSINSIKNGTSLAQDTSTVLAEVIEGVNQSVHLIDDISQASNSQAKSLEEALSGLEQISAVVHSNSATAEESSAASEELSSQADVLQELTSQFKF